MKFMRGAKELHYSSLMPDVEVGRYYLIAVHPDDAEVIMPIIDTNERWVKALLKVVDEERGRYLLSELEKFRAV